ncbi:MAG: bifunctional acetate--CoA ligase family protein/GNAT family N-acetyltransferase [Bacteroidetes bacterium]|nr:bifunctional acetate--CoA ligase family protein/GNAT family N-acetyltransferase [Bacteroidota bacterium]
MDKNLSKIFKAKTIAVIGASNVPNTVGYALIQNLIGSGYQGIVYPVNIKEKSVQGVRCYNKVEEIPDKIDLAVIATPSRTVPGLVWECGEAEVGGVVVISAGFKEAGEKGQEMVKKILKIGKEYNMRIVGPNCLGFINPELNLNVSFASKTAKPGRIAFISQSGALCTAILDWAEAQNVGFSHFVSIGSMIDVSFHDLIDYFGNDPKTSSILIYMESLTDARKFLSAARAFARSKPIIVLKAGKSSEGAKATLSHTGSLAGNDAVFDAAFQRSGVIRVDTIAQLFDCAQALSMQRRPAGNRLAIVTNAGGPGVLATDHLMEHGGALAQLSEKTMEKLNAVLPPTWSHGNPIDVIGDASAERYKNAVDACIRDENVDGVLVILTPQAVTDAESVAKEMVNISKRTNKTILAAWMGEEDVQGGRDIMERGNIPTYRFPESAVDVFLSMYHYSRNLDLLYETPGTIPHEFEPDVKATKKLINKSIKEKRYQLTELEGKQLMKYYDIPIAEGGIVSSAEDAAKKASEIGYPVVMKIASPDIAHKTDIGGVKLRIRSEQDAINAYNQIMESVTTAKPDAEIHGVLVEQMISKKYEVLIGSKKDPIFGPVIVFGMGGVTVEVFKDMHIGLPPLNMALAQRIIEETKIFKILKGYRGMEAVDIKAIQFLLYKFAYLVMDFPEIKEIDVNPFVVDADGGVVLDAVVVLDPDMCHKKIRPHSHLVISPYPKEYIKKWTMENGQEIVLRPIRPEDEPMEEEMFNQLSKETQYFRFFGFIPQVTHDMLTRYTQIDYDREIAIIAEVEESGETKMAGVVRLVADGTNETAEFAIVVADPWQGNGLGNKFTDYIIEIAKQRGIKKIYANVLKANKIMVYMFEKRGFNVKSVDFETYYTELDLTKVVEPAEM